MGTVSINDFVGRLKLGKHVNRVPLMILGVIIIVIGLSAAYMVKVRGKDVQEKTEGGGASTSGGHKTSVNSAENIIKDLHANKTSPPTIPDKKTPPTTKAATTSSSSSQKDSNKGSDIDEKERERFRKKKRELYEAAIMADTLVTMNPEKGTSKRGISQRPSMDAANRRGQAMNRLNSLAGTTMEGSSSRALSHNADPNMQGIKEAFSEKNSNVGYLSGSRRYPMSAYEIQAGTVIPAVMISGVNSDLPGQLIAQVSQNVYNSSSGEYLLIPQGTKLVGAYNSQVAHGQERVQIAWHQLNYPDGSYLDLGAMPGADQGGYSGFHDQVDNHYGRIFGNAILLSAISAGFQLSQPEHKDGKRDVGETMGAAVGQNLAQVGTEMVRRNMRIQPTLMIRPGYRFNVNVTKNIAFSGVYSK